MNTQVGKIRTLLLVSGSEKRLRKVQQLFKFLTFRSVHFHPATFTRPSFLIIRGSGSKTTLSIGSFFNKRGGRAWYILSCTCVTSTQALPHKKNLGMPCKIVLVPCILLLKLWSITVYPLIGHTTLIITLPSYIWSQVLMLLL